MSLRPFITRWLRGSQSDQPVASRRSARKQRVRYFPAFEPIEPRMMLHGWGLSEHAFDHDHGDHDHDEHGLEYYDPSVGAWLHAIKVGPLDFATGNTSGGVAAAGAKNPLSALPGLSSLPGAKATLYLDFNGHSESTWGSYRNVKTPVYDTDGDRTTFSDAELAAITEIWQRVSEDYAPFNVNVTTVDPGNFANGKALRVSIGGNGSWVGSGFGGIAFVDAFTNTAPNTVFVFSDNLSKGSARLVADATSHESGHGFGLQHQSKYSGTSKTAEYNTGTSVSAPLMGKSYSATRSIWWNGQTTSSKTIQDDMAVLAKSANGFGYRKDDHNGSFRTTSDLPTDGSGSNGQGIIGRNGDKDTFRFTTSGGTAYISVDVAVGANLDVQLQLFNDQATRLVKVNPATRLTASISEDLVAGTYYVTVTGAGGYGSVGQYTVFVTAPQAPAGGPIAASGETATPQGGSVGVFSGLVSYGFWGLAAAQGDQSSSTWALPAMTSTHSSAQSITVGAMATAFQPLPGAPTTQMGHDSLDTWMHHGSKFVKGQELPAWMEYEQQAHAGPRGTSSAWLSRFGEFGPAAHSGTGSSDLTSAKQSLFSYLSADELAALLHAG
jgi:hypothetical protein